MNPKTLFYHIKKQNQMIVYNVLIPFKESTSVHLHSKWFP